MDVKIALQAFRQQRKHAKHRGIAWMFTFKEWVDWWGADIEKRGVGHDRMQMQRVGDRGPYHPDNVRKGYPRDNSRTAANVRVMKNGIARLDEMRAAAFAAPTVDSKDERGLDDDSWELFKMFSPKSSRQIMIR